MLSVYWSSGYGRRTVPNFKSFRSVRSLYASDGVRCTVYRHSRSHCVCMCRYPKLHGLWRVYVLNFSLILMHTNPILLYACAVLVCEVRWSFKEAIKCLPNSTVLSCRPCQPVWHSCLIAFLCLCTTPSHCCGPSPAPISFSLPSTQHFQQNFTSYINFIISFTE